MQPNNPRDPQRAVDPDAKGGKVEQGTKEGRSEEKTTLNTSGVQEGQAAQNKNEPRESA